MAFLLCLLIATTTMDSGFASYADEGEQVVVESEPANAEPAEAAPAQAEVAQPAEAAPAPAEQESAAEVTPESEQTGDETAVTPEEATGTENQQGLENNEETTTPEEVANSDAEKQTPEDIDKETEKVEEDKEKVETPEKDKKDDEALAEEESEELEDEEEEALEEELEDEEELEEELEDEEELEEELEDEEELEEEEEEKCEHKNLTYKSNHDGSHGVYCADCGEFLGDEACEYDKSGKCIHCGYESIINQDIEKNFDGLKFVVKGRMPRGAQAEIKYADMGGVEDILSDNDKDDFTVFKAYDITIKDASGNVYQPEDHGYSLSITVKGISEVKEAEDEDVEVLRVEHDNTTLTELKSDVNNDSVTFRSEHFSVIIIGAKDDEILGQEYMDVESDEILSITGSLSDITKAYGRVKSLTIYVYLEANETFGCTADVRKGITDLQTPLSGTVVAECEDSKTATSSGWYPITITFDSEDSAWLAKNSIYSVNLYNFADAIKVQKGTKGCFINGGESDSDIKASVETDESEQPYPITSITLSSEKGKTVTEGKEIYYAVNDKDKLLVTAKDSTGKAYDVNVSWTNTTTAGTVPIQIGEDGTLRANNPGRAKVKATFGGVSSEEYTIIVYSIKLDGSTAALSKSYTGNAIEPVVTLNDSETDISKGSSTFSVSYSNNVDVGKASLTITGAGEIYSFSKDFTITKRNLNDYDFANAKYTIDTSTDTVTRVEDINKKSTITEDVASPTLDTDFTIAVTRKYIGADGIVYEAAISSMGSNYTGSVDLEEITYKSENLQLSDYVDITWKTTPNKEFSARPITFSQTDFNIRDKAGNAVELNLERTYENNTAGDEDHFGTVIFKDGSDPQVYQGEIRLKFYIAPANIERGEFTATWLNDVSTFTHTGEPIEPGDKLTLTYKSSDMSTTQTLVENQDYTLSYSDNVNTGNKAKITVTGIGSYTGTQTITFTIEGAFASDAIVYLNGDKKTTKENATEAGDWESELSIEYSGEVEKPNSIRVYLSGKGDLPTTDYEVAYSDDIDGTTSLSANAGKKYITITGADKYNNEKIIVSYQVSPVSINAQKVAFALTTSGKAKTYGKEDLPGEPINLTADDYTLKFYGNTMSQDDYTIECTNNVDASTKARYTITGKRNFTGTRTGFYTIAPATLTSEMIRFKDGEPLSVRYNGRAQEPEVVVSLRDTDMTGNYDVIYNNNIAKGTATATIVPKNNLTGDSRVKEFEITSKSLSTLTIKLNGHAVTPVSGLSNSYFCEGYAPTYTGSQVPATEVVYDGDVKLEKGLNKDYTVTTKNRTEVCDFETCRANNELNKAAQVIIKGQNNYAGESVTVYFNIVKRELNSVTTRVTNKSGGNNISIDWAENTVNKPAASDIKVTYNGAELVYDTDFEIVVEDEEAAKLSGASVAASVVGKGNYKGEIPFTYEIGKSMDGSNTTIQLINPLTNDVYASTNTDAMGNYVVTWLPGGNKPDVKVVANGTTLTKNTDYTLTYIGSAGDDYNSYGGENIVTIRIDGKNGYYGTKTIGYVIKPVALVNPIYGSYDSDINDGLSVREKKNFTYDYTGETIDVRNNLEVHYKVGSVDYVLNSTSDVDYIFEGDSTLIGPNNTITGGKIFHVTIEGKGNFSGKLQIPQSNSSYIINQLDLGDLQTIAPKPQANMENNSVMIVDQSSNASSPIMHSVDEYTETNGYYAIYSGDQIKFDEYIVVKDKNGKILTKNTDYIVRYTDPNTGAATNKNVGEASAYIEGVAGSNYKGTKEIKFTIVSISVGALQATVNSSCTYNKEIQMPEDITVTDGTKILQRHTDYDIYGIDIPEADSPADFRGNNREPGANKANYITIKGKGQYSGDLKVYFDIDLDIGASDFTNTVDTENNKIIANNDYARIEVSNVCDYDELPPVTIKYKKQNGDLVTVNPTTTGSSTSEKNYEVTRESIVPGPGKVTITGYNNGVYNCVKGSRTFTNISFQADMSKDDYSEGYIANYAYLDKGDYAFTAEHIYPEVHVAYGQQGVDYVLDYNEGDSAPSSAANYFVRVTAMAGSKYFKENTSIKLNYSTKYDLDDPVTKIEITGAGITWDSTKNVYTASYTGSPIVYGVKVSAGGYTISTTAGNGNFVITSDDGMTDTGLHLITVERNPNNSQVMGGPRMIPFEITGKSINAEDGGELTLATPTAAQGTSAGWYYTKDAIRPTPTVKLTSSGETVTLREGRDYTITYVNNYNVGVARATVTGIGAYSGTLVKEFNIIPRSITSTGFDVIVGEAHYVGAGIPVKPDVQVTYNGNVLIKDEDYVYSYDQNTLGATRPNDANPIYGLVNIEGRGAFSGELQKRFTIEQLDLGKTTVTVEDNSVVGEYTGKVITPKLSVKVKDYDGNDQTLVECSKDSNGNYVSPNDADYEITIYNASGQTSQIKNMGTYQVDIGGTVNCKGKKRIAYTVTKRSIANNWAQPGNDDKVDKDITITVSDVETFEGAATPSSITITDAGVLNDAGTGPKVLREGVDYTISYANNTTGAKGEYSNERDSYGNFIPVEDSPYVIITGMGNYNNDETKVAFNIGLSLEQMEEDGLLTVATPLGAEAVEGKYIYDGEKHAPTTKLTLADGEQLINGEDYTVTIKNSKGVDERIHAGRRTLTIKGTGKYYGKIERTYDIVKRQVLHSVEFDNAYSVPDTEFKFDLTDPTMRVLEDDEEDLYGPEFVGYYFEPYAGKDIKPTVTLYDYGLATESKVVDPSQYTVEYFNNKAAFDPTTTEKAAYANAKITFNENSDYDGSSKMFTCYFLIGPDDISDNSFTVRFAAEQDNQTNFVFPYTGEEVHPEMLVTDTASNKELTKGKDYDVYYAKGDTELKDLTDIKAAARATATKTITPGSCYVYVVGKGSYSGIRARNYAIVADLSDRNLVKIVTYDNNGNPVNGIKKQFLTGKEIVPEFDVRLYQADGTTFATLEKDVDYKVTVTSNDWSKSGTATINANSDYYTGSTSENFNIVLDPDMISIVDDNNFEYYYTGYEIKPTFKTNVSTIEIDTISYKRLSGGSGDNDFINNGKIQATLTLKVAATGDIIKDQNDRVKTWKVTYNIKALNINDDTVKVEGLDSVRYTGRTVKPTEFTVFIYSTNAATGDKQVYTLTNGKHYGVSYGTQKINEGKVVLHGLTTNVIGVREETFPINLYKPAALKITKAKDTTMTVQWINDMYANSARLKIEKLDANDNVVKTVLSNKIVTCNPDTTSEYVFSNLESMTKYKISIESVVVENGKVSIASKPSTISGATSIGVATGVKVESKSAGKVTVSWPKDNKEVTSYYIYRANDATSTGKLLAVLPVSTGSLTNSGLTTGNSYYYYIVGYNIVNGKKTRVSESEHIRVTVK